MVTDIYYNTYAFDTEHPYPVKSLCVNINIFFEMHSMSDTVAKE